MFPVLVRVFKQGEEVKAIIDNTYVLQWVIWYDGLSYEEQGRYVGALILMNYLADGARSPSILPGRVKYGKNRDLLLKHNFKNNLPGIDNTTWCIYFVYSVAKIMNLDTSKIVDSTGHIGNTSGNEMAMACRKNLKTITPEEAQAVADAGRVVIIAAIGRTGHVGIVAPSIPKKRLLNKNKPANFKKREIISAQAGGWNGFMPLRKAFPWPVVDKPTFHIF